MHRTIGVPKTNSSPARQVAARMTVSRSMLDGLRMPGELDQVLHSAAANQQPTRRNRRGRDPQWERISPFERSAEGALHVDNTPRVVNDDAGENEPDEVVNDTRYQAEYRRETLADGVEA